jgi:hypothetical protein
LARSTSVTGMNMSSIFQSMPDKLDEASDVAIKGRAATVPRREDQAWCVPHRGFIRST